MRVLHAAKTKLQEKLPLSTKLFLKRVFIAVSRPIRLVSKRTPDLAFDRSPAKNGWTSPDFIEWIQVISRSKDRSQGSERIRTSIVIPVFNNIDFTFQCLRSVLKEIDLNETDIIVVNNASTDQTVEVLSQFGDVLRVINNDENKGFGDACNQGASIAKGKYLVFLNNDTVVLEGWLKNLVNTAEAYDSVGAIGSLCLYPDGRIQEAGGIIWNNGEAYHCGWGKSADDHRFNFVREVDYCSAASLLVRKDLFERSGGFDHRYAPAYYEDVDLCFGVRSLGYRVLYQPASRIIHYEGATAGTDINKGIKQFQVVNQQKFFEKWRTELEQNHFARNEKLVRRASNRKAGPNLIVFDDRLPTPDRDAGSARMYFILKSLAKFGPTVFVYSSKPSSEADEARLWSEGIETVRIVDYRTILRDREFQVAILSRPEIAEAVLPTLRKRARGTKIIFDMVDAYYVRLGLEHEVTGNRKVGELARKYKKLELKLARDSDLVWCASSDDKENIEKEVPSVRIELIPTIHPLHSRGRPFNQRKDLFFAGNFAHRPNADGVTYFLENVFPLLSKALPGIEFHIAGSSPPPQIQALSSSQIHVMGFVPDIEPFFMSSRVFVAPLRFGAGVKGKIGDALSHGLPVVTTSIGAKGMGFENGSQVMIADDPESFAAAVVKLYQDQELWDRLAENGYVHMEQNFSPAVVERVIERSLKSRRRGALPQK